MFLKSVINIEIGNNIEQSLEFAQANGFDAIEIQNVWGKNIEMLEKDELNRLNQLVKAHNLKVSCISSTLFLRCFLDDRPQIAPEIKGFPTISGNYPSHLKGLQRAILAAQILDAPLIRVFGFQKENQITNNTFTQAAERFQAPIEQAKQAGITLALENCPHTSFGWGIHAVKLIQMINSPVFRLLWDPANSITDGEPDCIQAMPDIFPVLAHVHAKDVLVFPNGNRQYLAVGQGNVPWKVVFQELIKNNYDGAISIEPHFVDNEASKAGAVLESLYAMEDIISTISLPIPKS
jgi:sugar phosphate isomerase/epimerase